MEHSVVKSGESQRELTRDSLFMGAKMSISGSPVAITTVIRNLSAGGVMVDAPVGLKKQERVVTHLRNLGEVIGTVAWVHNGRAGVMFDEQINPDDVRSTIKKTSGAPKIIKGASLAPLSKGSSVEVNVPGIGTLRGTVDWIEDTRMGLSFEHSLFELI